MRDVIGTAWKLAWRNIWRNPRRTLITCAAVALGLLAILVMTGLVRGMNDRLIESLTEGWLADGQIMAPGYREAPDVETRLADGDAVLAEVRGAAGVRAASGRVLGPGMVAIGDRNQPVQLVGVDFAAERTVTSWPDRLVAGAWPEGPRDALVGRDLAEEMELEVGGPLVLTAAHVDTGDLDSVRLRVAGIVKVGDPLLDRSAAIVRLDTAQRLLALGDALHVIAVRVDDDAVLAALEAPGREVAGWRALAPVVQQMSELQAISFGTLLGIVGLILALGILNSLTMALVDRLQEFGVLRALGTRPRRLALMILIEAFDLGVVGVALGLALTAPVYWWASTSGIPMPGVEVGGVEFTHPLHARLVWGEVVGLGAALVALTVAVAGITAWRVTRVQPVEALRRVG
ncbi:MAG: ABC transporter permease [Myxococcales bacterium]|nr:ABC transporter permease [Myxococcales bacterium]